MKNDNSPYDSGSYGIFPTKDIAWDKIALVIKDGLIDDIMSVPASYTTKITPIYDEGWVRFEYGDGSYNVYVIEEVQKMMNVEIYQMYHSKMESYGFMAYSKIANVKDWQDFYHLVYVDTIPEEKIDVALDTVFAKFNINRPEDFTGHSLSVGDVVSINGNTYYCDSFGWEKITNWKY